MHIFAIYYFFAALLGALGAYYTAFWWAQAVLAWVAISLALVGAAYAFNIASIFRKRHDGSIPFYTRWLFIPVLLGAQVLNFISRRRDRVPPIHEIDTQLLLGCRLTGADLEAIKSYGITAVLDVTAEFDALDWSLVGENIEYLNIPILDHATPTSAQLTRAVNWIQRHIDQNRNILVHCALGRGRSVLVLAAYLLTQTPSADVNTALQRINAVRQTAKLNRRQYQALATMFKNNEFSLLKNLCLVVNPAAGSGLWPSYQALVKRRLAPYFDVSIYTTSKSKTATELAQHCLDTKADCIVACGGDGTVTAVATALIGTDTPLAIIPLGTANALAKVIGISGINDEQLINNACDAIISGSSRRIDTATVNSKPMLLLAALGFEQQMVQFAEDKKQQLGQLAYVQGLWQAMTGNIQMQLLLRLDDNDVLSLDTTSLVVANIAPASSVLAQGNGIPNAEDGLLDITWLESDGLTSHAISLGELCLNQLVDSESQTHMIQHRSAKSISITTNSTAEYVVDGECYDDLPLQIIICEKSLTLIVVAE